MLSFPTDKSKQDLKSVANLILDVEGQGTQTLTNGGKSPPSWKPAQYF